MKFITIVALYILSGMSLHSQEISYSVTKQPWPDSLGNHRAVLSVSKNTEAVEVKIDWRRRDYDAEQKAIVIIDQDGNKIDNL